MKYFIAGGAGFIGSHFVDRLIPNNEVTIYDNFSSGRKWHYDQHIDNPNLKIIKGDIQKLDLLTKSMVNHDVVIHLASNPDISKATTQPDIDFWQGTLLTNNVLEAMRRSDVKKILYASGSGVYGDLGTLEVKEDYGPLLPISTYGASKLAGESLISSYCYMFGLNACAFRFANVVGSRQTHGVGFDFLKRSMKSNELTILGDGTQSKSYIYVEDVIDAVLLASNQNGFNVYNVSTGDYITVTEIAKIAASLLEKEMKFTYIGGDRGWKGDVPIIRLNSDKIKSLGWSCNKTTREAIRQSMADMFLDILAGKM